MWDWSRDRLSHVVDDVKKVRVSWEAGCIERSVYQRRVNPAAKAGVIARLFSAALKRCSPRINAGAPTARTHG